MSASDNLWGRRTSKQNRDLRKKQKAYQERENKMLKDGYKWVDDGIRGKKLVKE